MAAKITGGFFRKRFNHSGVASGKTRYSIARKWFKDGAWHDTDSFGLSEKIYLPTKHLHEYEHIPEYYDMIESNFTTRINNMAECETYRAGYKRTSDFCRWG